MLHTYRSRCVTDRKNRKTQNLSIQVQKTKCRKIRAILYNWETADRNILNYFYYYQACSVLAIC